MHACNAQGVWGSGIAKEFKKRFPKSFAEYRKFCLQTLGSPGDCHISSENVISLITSENYGDQKDTQDKIVIQTILGLGQLIRKLPLTENYVYCNKFNSGLFAVPWEKMEAVLEYFSDRYGIEFVMCDPNLP